MSRIERGSLSNGGCDGTDARLPGLFLAIYRRSAELGDVACLPVYVACLPVYPFMLLVSYFSVDLTIGEEFSPSHFETRVCQDAHDGRNERLCRG